jgi:hypothetical protein
MLMFWQDILLKLRSGMVNFRWYFISTMNVVWFPWNFIHRKKTHLIWQVNFMHLISSQFHTCWWDTFHENSLHYNHVHLLTFINFHSLYCKKWMFFGKTVYLQCCFPQDTGTYAHTHNLTISGDPNDDHNYEFVHVCVFFQFCFVMSWISFHLKLHM